MKENIRSKDEIAFIWNVLMCAWGGKSRSHLANGKIPGAVCKIKDTVVGDNLDCWIAEG